MRHPVTELPMILVRKFGHLLDDEFETAGAAESIIVEVIAFTHECDYRSAHRILAALTDEGEE